MVLNGDNAASAGGYDGFLTPWNGAPIPSQIVQNPALSVFCGSGFSREIVRLAKSIRD